MKTFLQIWGWFVLHLLVAAGVYYAAFVVPLPPWKLRHLRARPFGWFASRYRWGLGIAAFIVVTPPATLGFTLYGRHRAHLLAAVVEPYPGTRFTAAGGRGWLSATDDAPEAVIAFYRDSTHRPQWTLVEDDTVALILERGGKSLLIGATRDWTETRIIYDVSRRKR